MTMPSNLPAATSPQPQPLSAIPQRGRTIDPSDPNRLRPAGERQGGAELLSCLTLVAPTGMTGDERGEWLRVAKMTLSGIPADLLERGCKMARETADHPAKIVKIIMAEAKETWDRRKRQEAIDQAQYANRSAPKLEQHDPEYVDPAEVRRLIQSIGGGQCAG